MIKLEKFFLLLIVCTVSSSADMAFVDAGKVFIGQKNNVEDEIPVHRVTLSAFYIGKYEVTIAEWQRVVSWAENNGYQFTEKQGFPRPGPSWYKLSKPEDFPMNSMNWYDVIKWCNAKSEMEGRTPCYYLDTLKKSVYRVGEVDLSEDNVIWQSSGYRLPTEAEWEKAARGKFSAYNYPWGNDIDGTMANFKNSNDPFELGSGGTSPVGYYDGNQSISSNQTVNPTNMENTFGLYDMVGNVSEWTWDWYDNNWYSHSGSRIKDSRGPAFSQAEKSTDSGMPLEGRRKVHRGGAFNIGIFDLGKPLRVAYRHVEYPHKSQINIGFRYVKSNIEDDLWLGSNGFNGYPNWYYLDWFGYYWQSQVKWVYHYQLGWIYPTGMGSYSNWIYIFEWGWMWTSKLVYPYFYSDKYSEWYEFRYDEGGNEFILPQL